MTSLYKRASLLGVAALTLGACEFGLGIDHSTDDEGVPAGTVIPVTNADGTPCPIPEGEETSPVTVLVLTEAVSEPDLEEAFADMQVVSTETDDEGSFSAEVEAPERPGPHMVFAVCADLEDTLSLDSQPYVDFITVAQPPLELSVDKTEVAPGEVVTATFSRCQNENDLGIFGGPEDPGPEDPELDPEFAEAASDYPDLVVTVDGEEVTTVEGEERYPTGMVDVPITLTEVGDHVIEGVCKYQTLDLDPELLEEMIESIPQVEPTALQAADYPLEVAPFAVANEAEVEASATVAVAAAPTPAPAPAPPAAAPTAVVAQPTFTG